MNVNGRSGGALRALFAAVLLSCCATDMGCALSSSLGDRKNAAVRLNQAQGTIEKEHKLQSRFRMLRENARVWEAEEAGGEEKEENTTPNPSVGETQSTPEGEDESDTLSSEEEIAATGGARSVLDVLDEAIEEVRGTSAHFGDVVSRGNVLEDELSETANSASMSIDKMQNLLSSSSTLGYTQMDVLTKALGSNVEKIADLHRSLVESGNEAATKKLADLRKTMAQLVNTRANLQANQSTALANAIHMIASSEALSHAKTLSDRAAEIIEVAKLQKEFDTVDREDLLATVKKMLTLQNEENKKMRDKIEAMSLDAEASKSYDEKLMAEEASEKYNVTLSELQEMTERATNASKKSMEHIASAMNTLRDTTREENTRVRNSAEGELDSALEMFKNAQRLRAALEPLREKANSLRARAGMPAIPPPPEDVPNSAESTSPTDASGTGVSDTPEASDEPETWKPSNQTQRLLDASSEALDNVLKGPEDETAAGIEE